MRKRGRKKPHTNKQPHPPGKTHGTNQAQVTFYLPHPVRTNNSFSLGVRHMQYDKSLTPWLLSSLPWSFIIILSCLMGAPLDVPKAFQTQHAKTARTTFPRNLLCFLSFVICHPALTKNFGFILHCFLSLTVFCQFNHPNVCKSNYCILAAPYVTRLPGRSV